MTIKMVDIKFEPETATADVGQEVCWLNEDAIQHNAVAESGDDVQVRAVRQGRDVHRDGRQARHDRVRVHDPPRHDREARSHDGEPAVDGEADAGHERGGVGGKVRHGAGDVCRLADTAGRHLREVVVALGGRAGLVRSTGTQPGATVFTVIPSGASSRAHTRARPSCAALAAAYAELPGNARSTMSEPTWMTRPAPARVMPGSTSRMSRIGLLTKNSSWSRWACQVSSSTAADGWGRWR